MAKSAFDFVKTFRFRSLPKFGGQSQLSFEIEPLPRKIICPPKFRSSYVPVYNTLCHRQYRTQDFEKGGGQKVQKIWEEHRSEFEIVSLKFRLIFRPKSGEEQKKKVFTQISFHFLPNIRWFRAQSLMPQFCSLFYAILQSWRPKRGAMAQCPLQNTPLVIANIRVECNKSGRAFRVGALGRKNFGLNLDQIRALCFSWL